MKYYIIAGEASGDLHGSNLIKEILANDAQANIQCWGGDMMQKAGGNVVKHIRDLAFMGFIEVLKNISTIQKNFAFCKQDILSFQPDVIVLIDYPGFNLRMAKWAKLKGFKIAYYISPQIWAWKENRIQDIKKYVDEMICILPFEKDFYAKWNINIHYVGHPLVQVIETFKKANQNIISNKKMIALLPGSRLQEIQKKLPILLSIVKYFPDYTFVIAQSPTLQANDYEPYLQNSNIELRQHSTYQILMEAHAAIVTSGTATLETALFGVPQIVVYKGNYLSYLIGKQLIKIAFISLVNLIANKKLVAELIQNDLTTENLKLELEAIIGDNESRKKMIVEYKNIHTLLGSQNASKLAAKIVCKMLDARLLDN
jgi:lipid-A-disaccharide synthase